MTTSRTSGTVTQAVQPGGCRNHCTPEELQAGASLISLSFWRSHPPVLSRGGKRLGRDLLR